MSCSRCSSGSSAGGVSLKDNASETNPPVQGRLSFIAPHGERSARSATLKIRQREVVSHEEQRLARKLRHSVCHAIAEIQIRRMTPLPEATKRVRRLSPVYFAKRDFLNTELIEQSFHQTV